MEDGVDVSICVHSARVLVWLVLSLSIGFKCILQLTLALDQACTDHGMTAFHS